eukprot:5247265-Pyramimonas_sp.AAC.1
MQNSATQCEAMRSNATTVTTNANQWRAMQTNAGPRKAGQSSTQQSEAVQGSAKRCRTLAKHNPTQREA